MVIVLWYVAWLHHSGISNVLCFRLLECLHSALCLHIMQWYFVGQIGNPVGMLHIVWYVEVQIIMLPITYLCFRSVPVCDTAY